MDKLRLENRNAKKLLRHFIFFEDPTFLLQAVDKK